MVLPSPINENSFRASLLHPCTRAAAPVPILLRHRLCRGGARLQNRFRHDLCKDLEALEALAFRPRVHLSNSTDPLQPLEEQHRHTLFVLEKLAGTASSYGDTADKESGRAWMSVMFKSSVGWASCRSSAHPGSTPKDTRHWVECSLAFSDDSIGGCSVGGPGVESRMDALRFLRKEDLSVFLDRPVIPARRAAARRWPISVCRTFSR